VLLKKEKGNEFVRLLLLLLLLLLSPSTWPDGTPPSCSNINQTRRERARAMATRYLIISLPVQSGATAGSLWSRLQDSISRHSFDTPLYRVKPSLPLLLYSPLRFAAAFSSDLLGLRSSTSQISAWAPSIRSWPSATISSRFTSLIPRPRSRSLLASICCDAVAICAVQCLCGGRLAQDPKADRGSRARRRGRERGTHRRWRPRRHLPHQVVLPASLTY
jgi:hypothetical protein